MPLFDEGLTPYSCVMGALPTIAQWAEGHPKWVVMRWTCTHQLQEDI